MKNCIVSVSGGAASAVALERVLQQFHGNVVPLFADTKTEDADLYRFLDDVERHLGVQIIRIADGRNVWQVFFDEGMIGNTRVDLCSRILKRDLIMRFVKDQYSPSDTVLAFGMGTKELTRTEGLRKRWTPYEVWNPLQQPPFLDRCEVLRRITDVWDIDVPRLYDEGFPHNNCGGACVKAGHGWWALLLKKRPATFDEWSAMEQRFIAETGKRVAILRDRRGGVLVPMTLEMLRHRIEHEGYRPTDYGDVCNCMGA